MKIYEVTEHTVFSGYGLEARKVRSTLAGGDYWQIDRVSGATNEGVAHVMTTGKVDMYSSSISMFERVGIHQLVARILFKEHLQ